MVCVKRNDKVKIIAGKDKGHIGLILSVNPKFQTVVVEGAMHLTHFEKTRPNGTKGGLVKREGPIAASNVMPICSSCSVPCRVNSTMVEGKKARICNRCKAQF